MSTIMSVNWRVANLDCEHDAAALSRGLAGCPGIADIDVLPKSAKIKVSIDVAQISPARLRDKLREIGFPVVEGAELPAQPKPWRNPKVLASLTSGLLLLTGWLVSAAPSMAAAALPLNVAAIVIGGYFFGRDAIEEFVF